MNLLQAARLLCTEECVLTMSWRLFVFVFAKCSSYIRDLTKCPQPCEKGKEVVISIFRGKLVPKERLSLFVS